MPSSRRKVDKAQPRQGQAVAVTRERSDPNGIGRQKNKMSAGYLNGVDNRALVPHVDRQVEIDGKANQKQHGQKRRKRAQERIAKQPVES